MSKLMKKRWAVRDRSGNDIHLFEDAWQHVIAPIASVSAAPASLSPQVEAA
jgi:hypothetical protein